MCRRGWMNEWLRECFFIFKKNGKKNNNNQSTVKMDFCYLRSDRSLLWCASEKTIDWLYCCGSRLINLPEGFVYCSMGFVYIRGVCLLSKVLFTARGFCLLWFSWCTAAGQRFKTYKDEATHFAHRLLNRFS